MKILNLGCGAKTSAHPSVVNIDWSILLRIRTNPLFRFLVPVLLNNDRLVRFRSLPKNILVYDLAKGVPFPDASVDVVYHSHMLEHLDRDIAEKFMIEVRRVLKPGGVQRIVVPDLERCCRRYLDHLKACEIKGTEAIVAHEAFLEPLLLQSVRREAFGTSQQRPLRRFVENLLLGDARHRGETHQWMYDRFNLQALLERTGYTQVTVQSFNCSQIPAWMDFRLDTDDKGMEYKPGSLYIEAIAE